MRRLTACLMLLSVTGCAPMPSDSAICSGTRASRADLAGALLTDGGPQSQRAGLLVLEQMQAGCGR